MFEALMRTTPTTQAGIVALLEFLASPRPGPSHPESRTCIDYVIQQWWTASPDEHVGDDPAENPIVWLTRLAAMLRRLAETGEEGLPLSLNRLTSACSAASMPGNLWQETQGTLYINKPLIQIVERYGLGPRGEKPC